MGVRYATQFPSTFVERIEKLKDYGIDSDFEGMQYTVLVYIGNIMFVATVKGTHQWKTYHSVTFTTLIDVIFTIFCVVLL
jgi:hypothetical protein